MLSLKNEQKVKNVLSPTIVVCTAQQGEWLVWVMVPSLLSSSSLSVDANEEDPPPPRDTNAQFTGPLPRQLANMAPTHDPIWWQIFELAAPCSKYWNCLLMHAASMLISALVWALGLQAHTKWFTAHEWERLVRIMWRRNAFMTPSGTPMLQFLYWLTNMAAHACGFDADKRPCFSCLNSPLPSPLGLLIRYHQQDALCGNK